MDTDEDILWETVDDTYRVISRTAFLNTAITKALLEYKTIKVPSTFKVNKIYRWAKSRGLSLHRKSFNDFAILWVDGGEV